MHGLLLLLVACSAPPDAAVAPARPGAVAHAPAPPAPLPATLTCEAHGGRECFLAIPAGTGRRASGEEVAVPAFRLQRYEMSLAMFQACVQAGWCAADDAADDASPPGPTTPDRPVAGLGWEGARRLCAYVGGRLPTDVEWDRAVAGDARHRFAWGDAPGCGRRPAPAVPPSSCSLPGVGVFGDLEGGAFGLMAMSGNLWEWVADAAPPGEGGAPRRTQRGGGWLSTELADLEQGSRAGLEPDRRLPDVGVRCARDEAP